MGVVEKVASFMLAAVWRMTDGGRASHALRSRAFGRRLASFLSYCGEAELVFCIIRSAHLRPWRDENDPRVAQTLSRPSSTDVDVSPDAQSSGPRPAGEQKASETPVRPGRQRSAFASEGGGCQPEPGSSGFRRLDPIKGSRNGIRCLVCVGSFTRILSANVPCGSSTKL